MSEAVNFLTHVYYGSVPDGGWFGIDESAILAWAYINEEDEK